MSVAVRRCWALGMLGPALLVLGAGCARDQDYIDVMNEQEEAWKELTAILRTVKDAPTLAEAKKTLDTKAEKYAAIAQKASALPKPPPAKVRERIEQNSFVLQRTLDHLKAETERVARLPGGADLLKQFESTKGLLSAVRP